MGPFYAAATTRFENFIEVAKLTGFKGLNTITGTKAFLASQAQRLYSVVLLFPLKRGYLVSHNYCCLLDLSKAEIRVYEKLKAEAIVVILMSGNIGVS